MASNEFIIYEITPILDDSKLSKQFAKVENTAKKSAKEIDSAFTKSVADGISNSLQSLRNQVLSLGGAFLAALGAKEAIQASIRQEEAVLRLENSLRRIGEFSVEASNDLQQYASSIQKVTRFGDEAILEQLAFAQGLGATADQAKQVVSAATDLSSALGIDLNSAVRNITKTLSGQKGELGELIPALRGLTAEQLKNGEGIKVISELYRGFAERDTRGLGAAIDRTKNSFGDFLEVLGSYITRSEKSTEVTNSLAVAFDYWSGRISKEVRPRSLEFINNELVSVSSSLANAQTELQALQSEVNQGGFSGFLSQFGGRKTQLENEIKELQTRFIDLEQEAARVSSEQEQQRLIKSQKSEEDRLRIINEGNAAALMALQQAGITQILTDEEIYNRKIDALMVARERELLTDEQFNSQVLAADQALAEARKRAANKADSERLKGAFDANRAFGNIVASGTQTFVKSLLEGEKAGTAFKNFILGAFGDLATQLGSFYIATGIAQLKLFSLDPTGTIAAGAALVALGQILSSFQSGGLAGANSGGGGDFAAGTTPDIDTIATDQIVEQTREPQATVTVNQYGTYLTGAEAGEGIVDLINEAVDGRGVTLRTGVIA